MANEISMTEEDTVAPDVSQLEDVLEPGLLTAGPHSGPQPVLAPRFRCGLLQDVGGGTAILSWAASAPTQPGLRSVPAVPVPSGHAVVTSDRALGDTETRKRLALRCQVLFVGGAPGVADDLRGQVQLSRLTNLSGTVLRPGYARFQGPSICIGFSRRASAGGWCGGGGPAFGHS